MAERALVDQVSMPLVTIDLEFCKPGCLTNQT